MSFPARCKYKEMNIPNTQRTYGSPCNLQSCNRPCDPRLFNGSNRLLDNVKFVQYSNAKWQSEMPGIPAPILVDFGLKHFFSMD
jgi:hypothetical protein